MNTRRRLKGVVLSNKMTKTVVVEISRTFRHPLYQKVIHTVSKMKAHDELNSQVGDLVEIIESKPISRTKRWTVEKIIGKQAVREEITEETPAATEG
jgi:small subunit ribosomal protein S17